MNKAMNKRVCSRAFLLMAGLAVLCVWAAFSQAGQHANYHAVVIQGAGYLPGGEKPKGTDAITHATTQAPNTYSLTRVLSEKLAGKITVSVVQWTECKKNLDVLKASPDGKRPQADLVIFAGPSHYSKQPEQLAAIYPKLKEAVLHNPRLIASALVPAWYPKDKGKKTLQVAEKAFAEARVRSVPGVSLLTPRKDKPGATDEEVDKALSEFVVRVSAALEEARQTGVSPVRGP